MADGVVICDPAPHQFGPGRMRLSSSSRKDEWKNGVLCSASINCGNVIGTLLKALAPCAFIRETSLTQSLSKTVRTGSENVKVLIGGIGSDSAIIRYA